MSTTLREVAEVQQAQIDLLNIEVTGLQRSVWELSQIVIALMERVETKPKKRKK